MPDFPTIADLERARKKQRLSIYELCRAADIAESLYHRWKNGKVNPSMASLKKAYEALDARQARGRA